jgi:plasmid stability protein
MATLYLRNMPDDVSNRLAVLAEREGLSVSAFAVRELTEASRRADNAALLGALPDLGVLASDVVADIESERAAR